MKVITADELTPELAAAGCAVTGMSNDEYHAYPAISKSGLDLIDRSPAHYAFRSPWKPTRYAEIGTAIHTAMLEPQRFKDEYVLLKDIDDRRKSEYKQAIAVHGSERVLVASEAAAVVGMQESVRSNIEAAGYLSSGTAELSVFASDPVTGVLCKARIDWLTADGRTVIDLKKTQDVRYMEFQRSVARYRYHVQDAFYRAVLEWAGAVPPERFLLLCVEQDSPHACKLYELDTEARMIGERAYRENLNTYADCEFSDYWPSIGGETELMSLPAWALDFSEEIEL